MVKHRQLDSHGFPAPYAASFAKAKITAGRLSLARSAITLRSSYPGESHLGAFWWIVRGISTVFTLLNPDLTPSLGFRRSPATYRGDESFLLAEALTHWTAQKHLDVDVLLPVERYPHLISMAPVGTSVAKTMPKGYRNPRKNTGRKSAPDFIGFGADVHVLESKGRANFTWGVTNKVKIEARNKALHQVCRVNKVDGDTPTTRTACVFSFETGCISGAVDDPGPTEHFDLRSDRALLLRAYYAVVLDPRFRAAAGRDRGGYTGVDIAPDWRLSIDRNILDAAEHLEGPASADRLLTLLRNRRAQFDDASKEGEDVSVGPDGIKLEGPAHFELPSLRKIRG